MKLNNIRPERTIHVSFVPDEEIGGENGFGSFVLTKFFRDLKIGIALDEGMASPNNNFGFYNSERLHWGLFNEKFVIKILCLFLI